MKALSILILTILGLQPSMLSAQTSAPQPPPNLILIMADDLGWADLGFQGLNQDVRTPHLDRLAREGMILEQFYVQHVCTPTRAALMTGRYPYRFGLQSGVLKNWNEAGLPLTETTLAQSLKGAGYRTAIIGKWHLGHYKKAYLPTNRGFDSHYGFYTCIDYFSHIAIGGGHDWQRDGQLLREKGYVTNLLNREVKNLILEHDFDTPLFLYLPTFPAHGPLAATERDLAKFDHVPDKQRRILLAMNYAMDRGVGTMIEALTERAQLENTLILFTADNGGIASDKSPSDNGPLRGGKGSFHEGGLRVPTFAYWKGKIAACSRSTELMHVVDLFPTFCALAEADTPAKLDGHDLTPVLFQTGKSPRTSIIHSIADSKDQRSTLRREQWKFLQSTNARTKVTTTELYDILKDPNETTNLAESHPEVIKSFLSELQERLPERAPDLVPRKDLRKPKDWDPETIGPFLD